MQNIIKIFTVLCLNLMVIACDAKQQRADRVEQSIATSEQDKKSQTEH